MIVLDTNVVSALMDAPPDPVVVKWLDRQPFDSVWITSVTVFEVRFGLELLPRGRRRESLESAFRRLIAEKIENRILSFDEDAATIAASLAAQRQRESRRAEIPDTQIAGIVIARRAALATRNVRHFSDIDAPVVNPWMA